VTAESGVRAEAPRWRRVAKIVLSVAAMIFVSVALRNQWRGVRDALVGMNAAVLLVSTVAAASAIACSGEQQRRLLSSWAAEVPRAVFHRVFYAAQLGKYLPGSAWAYVAQMELSKERGIGRAASTFAIALGALMTVLTAGAMSGLLLTTQPFTGVPEWARVLAFAVCVLVLVVILARPLVVDRFARWGMGKVHREVPSAAPTAGHLRWAIGWSLVAWLGYGFHLWLLMVDAGGPALGGWTVALGGFATAWVCGFLVFFLPAGIGVREAVLVAVLTGAGLDAATALAVSLVSRFLIVLAEVLLAVPSSMSLRRHRLVPAAVAAEEGPS